MHEGHSWSDIECYTLGQIDLFLRKIAERHKRQADAMKKPR